MMNTNQKMIKIGGVEVLVIKKNIKNIHLNVLPPDGIVRVSTPLNVGDDVIRTFLSTKISWIKKKQNNFKKQERQTIREYVSGEDHYLFGKRYILEVIYNDKKKNCVSIKGRNKILLSIKNKSDLKTKETILNDWYREQLKLFLNENTKKWEEKIGVGVKEWKIKRMKTRWGSCNRSTKKIWLNLELVKKPVSCIEYVLVHELIHLIEKKHNDNFIFLLDKHIPNWRSEKEKINEFILSHEKWNKQINKYKKVIK